MEDESLKKLIIKIAIWLAGVIVFGSLMTITLINKFGSKEITINKKIDKQETVMVLVIDSQTNNTKTIKSYLEEENIPYEIVNKDSEMYFDDFLNKLSITNDDIVPPTLIYIEDKQAIAILTNVEDLDELKSFLEYNTQSGKE